MASLFGAKKHLTGNDLIKELKSMYSSTKKILKDFEDRFELFAKFIERAEGDSVEFVCQSYKGGSSKSGGVASRTTVLTKEDDARQIAQLKQKLCKKNAEINRLNKQLSDQEKTSNDCKKKHHEDTTRLHYEKNNETERVKVLEAKTKEQTTEMNRLREQCREAERNLNRIESENARLRQDIQQLRQKFRKRIVLYTHTTLNSTLSSQVIGELMTNLGTHLKTDGVELDQRKYNTGTGTTDPLLAICINFTTLSSDVQEVLKNIKKEKHDIAVLVLHHKDTHALPKQTSDKMLMGSEYKKVGAIIDVAFLQDKGMYPCEMNSAAMRRLVSFLLQYKTDISHIWHNIEEGMDE